MRAVILAGGKGRRLFPYTLVVPKPLVPLSDMPILEVVVRQLAANGFDDLTLAVGYHAELIMAVMGDGHKWGVNIDYSLEDKPLNTIGPLALIDRLDQPFLVMNGDLLTDLNYSELMAYHQKLGCIATVATCKRHVKISLGVLKYNSENRMTAFQEKPEFDYDVSMGVYIFEPRIMNYIERDQPLGFDQLMLKLLDADEPVSVYPFRGEWLDMGTPEDLQAASEHFETNRDQYLPQ
ncbi:MAG: NTP transferase domain-containing protein [bacterium]|nr:NTP transferase domain-containing protein [bacterium]